MPRRLDPKLDRFLLPGERVVVDVRQHWGVVAGPVAAVVGGLVLVLWVDAHVRLDGGPIARALWLLWFVSVGWLLFQLWQWRHDRFIATDKRLLLDYGIFTTKVAMMPLTKVTDMSFQRSVPGRVFGWGRFILESAGQDQALRQIDWVPDPDHTYRLICAEIFGVIDDGLGEEDDNGRGRGDLGPPGPGPNPLGSGPAVTSGPIRAFGQEGRWPSASPVAPGHSRAIPLRRRPVADDVAGSADGDLSGEVLYSSDDERRLRRSADTGPLPVHPPRDGRRSD
jgi:membrane protein YdbS with pleckstrin-like domain